MNYATRPGDNECFGYHREYVGKVPDGDILETLRRQASEGERLIISSIPAAEFERVHPPYTWSVRTVIEHCLVAERVYGYRAMRVASGDGVAMPGWDENRYADCGMIRPVSPQKLADEFVALRMSNILLLERLAPDAWSRIGEANNMKFSARTQAWLMAGHWIHHAGILCKRLGLPS